MSGNNDDAVEFSIIEAQKENIQALPSGRSARTLANLFSASPLQPFATPTPTDTNNVNDAQRAQFESELQLIDETDDPLDIYDRYVKWTMDAYPSAQATPQSQLLPLLERATKTFLTSTQYKNDPRYLKLWLLYIRFFSDTPRETYAFLSRHAVGQELALFYEEFAAWLEGAKRWAQAEEIYQMGLTREARPVARLQRKYNEFQQRLAAQPQERRGSDSPALPPVRKALGQRVDPFAPTRVEDPQAQQPTAPPKASGKKKMAIFSDADAPAPAVSESSGMGWDSIGSMTGRKKENYVAPRPMMGETLSTGGRSGPKPPKMQIFKDESIPNSHFQLNENSIIAEKEQVILNAKGRYERIYVNLEAMYPMPEIHGSEICSEELMARERGYLDVKWEPELPQVSHVQSKQKKKGGFEVFSEEAGPAPQEAPKQKTKGGFEIFSGEEVGPAPQEAPKSNKKGGFEIFSGDEVGPALQQAPKLKKKGGFEIFPGEEAAPAPREASLSRTFEDKIEIGHENGQAPVLDENGQVIQLAKQGKQRRIKRVEVNETQTIKTKLSSPSQKKKVSRRKSNVTNEPTMTFHTKAATDDIYELFNQPAQKIQEDSERSESESDEEDEDDDESDEDMTDGDYTTDAESTGTGRLGGMSEAGDNSDDDGDETTMHSHSDDQSDARSVKSDFSDFTTRKHVPKAEDSDVEMGDGDVDMDDAASQMSELHLPGEHSHDAMDTDEPQHQHFSTPPGSPKEQVVHRTMFVPVPPENFVAPTHPYRNQTQISQNRLPFMTPIAEKTENSMGLQTGWTNKLGAVSETIAETPSKESSNRESILPSKLDSSPFQELVNSQKPRGEKIPPPALGIKKQPLTTKPIAKNAPFARDVVTGPIVKEAQCNPVDDYTRAQIFAAIHPPVQTYEGFFDHSSEVIGKSTELKRFSKAVEKMKRNTNDKTMTNLAQPPVLRFPGTDRQYMVKRELGAGAFAPVYLVENVADENQEEDLAVMGKGAFDAHNRRRLEALKMEDPPTAWEFYIMRQAKRRLGVSRAAESVVSAYEFHLYKDECFLIEEFCDQGTLLDLVNIARADSSQAGGVMDEILAMFFAIELLRTIEALHKNGILHGDLKADNILVRLGPLADDKVWSTRYRPDGTAGWTEKGVALIDFGRGIDMRAFRPDVGFIADWKTGPTDCAEMRELRPWTYQIDYFGLAGIMHSMLFGKYIDTVADNKGALPGAAGNKKWRVKESLKRYWQTEIWGECFDLLLNPTAHTEHEEGGRMPVLKSLKTVREKMEKWVEENCEKGMGLQTMLRKLEWAIKERRR